MREVLFRGKTKTGIWIEGFLFQTECDGVKDWCISMTPLSANDYSEILGDWGEIIPETVGQYTGLTDKSGKKIFEGDIVQIKDFTHGCALNYEQPTSNWVVHWREDIARFCIDYMSYLPFDFTETEIIGNIHDNPELLKGGNNGE